MVTARKLIADPEPQALTSDDPYISVVVAESHLALGQPRKAADYYTNAHKF